MAKIVRKTAAVFAAAAAATDIEQFSSKVATGTPNYSSDPAVIQALAGWSTGWSSALVASNKSEYKQDRNAVDFVASYQIAYILQMGIPEWDSGTTYYTDSVVQSNGNFYISQQDSNLNNAPPSSGSTALWRNLTAQPTQTIFKTGSGNYTPPAGCVYISVRMVGAGGGGGSGGGNGGNTTFSTFTAGGGGGGAPGSGGTASGGSVNVPGANGSTSGVGGSTALGGAGAGSTAAAANSGSGGGGGGGAGGYMEFQVNSPGTVAYSIGAGGTAGSGGGNGGSGLITVTEFYY